MRHLNSMLDWGSLEGRTGMSWFWVSLVPRCWALKVPRVVKGKTSALGLRKAHVTWASSPKFGTA